MYIDLVWIGVECLEDAAKEEDRKNAVKSLQVALYIHTYRCDRGGGEGNPLACRLW